MSYPIVRPALIPTTEEKAALAGEGTNPPSALNPFATMADLPAGGGDVTGPVGAVPGNFPALDDTGKVLSDSGYAPGSFEPADAGIQSHIGIVAGNPHGTTASDVGAVPAGDHPHTEFTNLTSIAFDITPTVPAHAEGQMYWDETDKTLAINMAHTDVTLQVGQEQFVRVFNNTGGAIANGKIVYINGVSGNRPTVALADASTEATQYVLGVVTHTLDASGDGRYGYCTVQGIVRGFDTQGMTPGLPLWLSETAGAVTQERPDAPAHAVYIGIPLNATNNGSIYVNPRSGYEIGELHDVLISGTPAEDEVLQYNASTAVWENGSPKIPLQYATENNGPAGFPVHAGITLSLAENYGAVNDTFRVTVTGTDFIVYCDGTRYVKSTEYVEQVGATTKRYYVYYGSDGSLAISDSPWSLEAEQFNGEAPVCTVYWDAVNHRGVLEEERHHSWRDIHWHHWAHDSIGARYRSGFNLTKPVAAGDIADFSISQGETYDEDISLVSNLTPATTCTLWYHNGADMVFERDSVTLFKSTAGVPQYDNGTGLAGKTQSNTTGYFVSWVYAGNSYSDTQRINVVIGQDTDGTMTLAEAQNASAPSVPAGFIIEWKLIYKIIWRYGATATTWISTTDYRQSSSLPTGLVPTVNVTAASVSFSPSGDISSLNVQGAIEELDSEKSANSISATHTAGTIELGHASDTTIARVSAGVASIEGKNIALNGTAETLTTGTIELGAASDTTIARVSAGVASIEGKNICLDGTTETHTVSTIELGHASDTTISRSSAGVIAVEGSKVMLASNTALITDRIVAIFDGGGSEIADNKKVYVYVPFACSVKDWTILADQSGSATIDVWKVAYASHPPVVGNSITSSNKITLSSADQNQDVDVTNWAANPQTISAGDVLCFNVDSCTTCTWLNVTLTVTRTV